MNPSTAQAMVIADELARNGVLHVVVCPGSRNAPLSMALVDADAQGKLKLHVRVDERSAGFLAMGLAESTGRPAAVVCTSGTAVANFHPAVLESYHSGAGLIVISADRPPELHGTGANQTIDQRNLFAPAAILVDFPVAERREGQNPVWRGLVCRAVAQAESGRPVQINVPFREPLVPTGEPDWPDSLDGRPGRERWTTSAPPRSVASSRVDFPLPARTLMVVGSGRPDRATAACEVATRAGWPIIAEPVATTGNASVLRCGPLLLGSLEKAPDLRPEAVVVVGRPTLSRGVRGLMGRAPVYGIGDHPQWTDPQFVAIHVRGWLDTTDLRHVQGHDPEWLTGWRTAADRAATVADKLLEEDGWPSGLRIARDLVAALPSGAMLFLGSSNPVRDVDLVAEARDDVTIHANRGVAGIDGNVSAAIGLALGYRDRPAYALLGDLTFLHDSNGLLIGPPEARPDLTIVVLNDDGGGIFSLLEQGAPEHGNSFERVFGTPHGADLRAMCAAYQVRHVLAGTPEQLREALRPERGLRVVEVRADRTRLRDLHARLREAVTNAAFG
ncbi:2-succinyl-5-enolpyruvyl-6-hydroxy-3-cyclohexene-1-carboxylic-acid synthase [Kibdelosporangium phytohabitans]|uniref:2-succinyl-5-enolpyruvyl-6-hydroxy-3-cyclohexene-1-carboxylate synthase n=1 Tax=Kibdelosporangium phytohabitans TaxID=860235 RepID=A0A0N9ICF3_9PSEU|nr:2-succinyl-5-enolpyruvyl-6-hydroxy-3-cyclohexene-1-carboxylic-acid synthase [Kibdelosporangium phytohabitans]ALG13988.1 2-succinyl-5-enolpyruvyl-6-hydroxy-3-cyclohexene-1-carboxylate synthase [Kibdelosporangium phytohabitans]MBE1467059.1 2-succinyl-5-enolpyruvyl-6-hydroxy-3-cyclohexene-1-carboxylate synthase [Kibdelosporangium phytohabitans]